MEKKERKELPAAAVAVFMIIGAIIVGILFVKIKQSADDKSFSDSYRTNQTFFLCSNAHYAKVGEEMVDNTGANAGPLTESDIDNYKQACEDIKQKAKTMFGCASSDYEGKGLYFGGLEKNMDNCFVKLENE